MSAVVPRALGSQAETPGPSVRHLVVRLAWALLVLELLVGLPLFLRMPVWCDVSIFDLAVRNLLGGGVPYRDLFQINFPGMLWIHLAIRGLLGWSSEAMRAVDVAVVAGVIGALVLWLKTARQPPAVRAWTAAALCGLYLAVPEHCHCQRDIWALLPALVALHLRRRRLDTLLGFPTRTKYATLVSVCEGACWGAVVWIKPHLLLPGLACWIVSLVSIARLAPQARGSFALDTLGTLGGGMLVGGLGILWLCAHDAWWSFQEIMLTWRQEDSSESSLHTTLFSLIGFGPWSVIHLIALPLALWALCRVFAAKPRTGDSERDAPLVPDALLASVYLAWLLQATFLQSGFGYHHLPPLMLGITLVAGWPALRAERRLVPVCLVLFGMFALLVHPLLKWERTSAWYRCFSEPASPHLWDRLALTDAVDWQDLDKVAAYLHAQDVKDGEMTCSGVYSVSLYLQMNVRPASRFHCLATSVCFPSRRGEIYAELAQATPRFIVSDVRDYYTSGLSAEQARAERPGRPLALPPAFPEAKAQEYPWYETVLFRAGRYYVHRATDFSAKTRGPINSHRSSQRYVVGMHTAPR